MNKLILYFLITIITLNGYTNDYILNNDSLKKDTTNFILPKNSIYMELFGSAWAGSINYERCLFAKSNYAINGRVGFFTYPFYPSWLVIFPILVNYQFNIKKITSFEIGAGQQFIPGLHLNEYNVNLIGNFGLRLIIRKNFLIKTPWQFRV